MRGPSNLRLRTARMKAGYPSARAAALAMGVPVDTYGQHERGTRGINADKLENYFDFFARNPARNNAS